MTTEAAPKLPPKPFREQARVLYPYEAQNEDELTINEGDIINVLSKEIEDQGWFKGELNGKVGVFPDNFVELIRMAADGDEPKPPPPRPKGSKTDLKSSAVDGGSTSKLNGSKSESKTPTILGKILGGQKKPAASVTTNLNVSNSSPGRGSPSGILSSSPKSSALTTSPKVTGKPDVVPHSETHESSRVEMLNRSVSSAEENETITDLDTSVTKLLTNPTKPKGPSNRRPPSYIAIVKDESGLENGDSNNKQSINHENNKSSNNNNSSSDNNPVNNHVLKLNSPINKPSVTVGHNSSAASTNIGSSAPKVAGKVGQGAVDKDNDQPTAPWMIELRKTQELKRGGSKDVPPTSSETVTPTDAPVTTIPGIVPRPISSTSAAARHGHRASGDFTARMQALLKKDNSLDKESSPPDVVATPVKSVAATESSPTSSAPSNLINNNSSSILSKPNKPMNKPTHPQGSSPLTNSVTSLTNSTSNMNTSSATTGSKINTSNNNNSVSSSNNYISMAPNQTNCVNEDDKGLVEQLQRDVKAMKENMVSRREFDDVIKQVSARCL